jgi:hypothetical protein
MLDDAGNDAITAVLEIILGDIDILASESAEALCRWFFLAGPSRSTKLSIYISPGKCMHAYIISLTYVSV